MTGRIRLAATLIACCILLRPATAAPPQITRITTPTLQIGSTATITIEGTDLLPNPRALLTVPIVEQTIKEGATDRRVQIEIKLADDVLPGVYLLRLASDKGISNPGSVEIDEQPPQPFGLQIARLPACLQGALAGSAVLSTTLQGKKGQRLVIEVEAQRIGSIIDPVIKLLDPRRVQLAWAQGSNVLSGDARLSTVLPVDGTYTIELHDLQYRAGNPNRFRLKVGDFQYADLTFPLAGRSGTKGSFQLIGNVPENTRVEADLTNAMSGSFVPLPRVPDLFSAVPRIRVSDLPEIVESQQPEGKLQEVTPPVAINGRLLEPNEEDAYRVMVQPGMKLKFDLLAERAGSLLDGVLILRNESGTQLARGDDQMGTLDPGLEYTVPPGVTSLAAVVSDVHGRGGPNFVYRLAITSETAGEADFSLALLEDRLHVPRNGAAVLRVQAVRAGYDGPIKLTLPGLPTGITVTGEEIPAGATDTLLTLIAKPDAKLTQVVLPQVIGESTDPKVPLRCLALVPETPLTKAMPWWRSQLAIAITEPEVIQLAWESSITSLLIGSDVTGRVTVSRSTEAMGAIRLSLLTSQVVPRVGGGQREDVNQAIRLDGMPTIAANQTTAEVKVLVPAGLPEMTYDVAVLAELLSADGRTVLATTVTPAVRLTAAK